MEKQIIWMRPSLKELRAMPEDVKDEVGFALDTAQKGGKVPYAAPRRLKRAREHFKRVKDNEDEDT